MGDVSIPSYLEKDDDKKDSAPEFCLDAGISGNIARFINHSCQPNLFVQCVLSTHHDIKLARVMLFAADNIPPLKVFTLISLCIYNIIYICVCVYRFFLVVGGIIALCNGENLDC